MEPFNLHMCTCTYIFCWSMPGFMYNPSSSLPPCSVQEAHSIMTFVLSKSGRHALLNVATQVYMPYFCIVIPRPLSLLQHSCILLAVSCLGMAQEDLTRCSFANGVAI
jgi:hypothetical protein